METIKTEDKPIFDFMNFKILIGGKELHVNDYINIPELRLSNEDKIIAEYLYQRAKKSIRLL